MIINKNNNLTLYSLILILFLYPLTCLAEPDQQINYLHNPKRIEWVAGGFYEGHFSNGTPFQMTLIYEPPKKLHQHHDLVRPLAWYQLSADSSGKGFGIDNFKFHQNHFKLSNATPSDVFGTPTNNSQREVFIGTLSPNKQFAQGIWTRTRELHKRTLGFTMHRVLLYRGIYVQQPIPLPEGDNLKEQEQFRDVYRPFEFAAIFPVVKSQIVNRLLAKDSNSCDDDQECSNSIVIAYRNKNRLSLSGEFYSYGMGAAHGNAYRTMRNFITSSKGTSELSLNKFMNVSLTCRKKLANLIVPKLDDPYTDWHKLVTDQLLPEKTKFFQLQQAFILILVKYTEPLQWIPLYLFQKNSSINAL